MKKNYLGKESERQPGQPKALNIKSLIHRSAGGRSLQLTVQNGLLESVINIIWKYFNEIIIPSQHHWRVGIAT